MIYGEFTAYENERNTIKLGEVFNCPSLVRYFIEIDNRIPEKKCLNFVLWEDDLERLKNHCKNNRELNFLLNEIIPKAITFQEEGMEIGLVLCDIKEASWPC